MTTSYVYTKRLYLGALPTNWAAIYTAPSSTVVVRDIRLQNTGASPGTFYITVQAASGSPSATVLVAAGVAPGEMATFDGRVALELGDELWANAGGGAGNCVITGYVFE